MRYLFATLGALMAVAMAQAHFVFVYVTDEKTEARVVFGHTAAPDTKTAPTRAAKTTLVFRDALGAETQSAVEKGAGNFYSAKLTGKPVVVYGTTEAGVTQRGDMPPLLSWYYPKVLVGDPFTERAAVGPAVPLDIIPVRDGDRQVRFRVLAHGKPIAGVDVTVGLPGKDEDAAPTLTTEADGLTTGFADQGRYCVAARRSEDKAGELGGQKYSGIRHTATLVFDFAARPR